MSLAWQSLRISLRRLQPVPLFFLLLLAARPGLATGINGTDYAALKEISGRLGMQFHWIEEGRSAELKSAWTRMRFELHQREFLLNDRRVHLGYPIAGSRGQLHLSESDYRHQLQPVLTPQVFGAPPIPRHIMIDPGHGGKDPGAENTGLRLREKALTLDLARRLKPRLEAQGFIVSMTRDADRFVALGERAQIANRAGADLFLSLHFNALEKTTVSGVETFAFTPPFQPSTARASLHVSDRRSYAGNRHDPWNSLLAYYVQHSLVGGLSAEDRGVKRARFAVLKELQMPGILIEGGFVSHPTEGRNIGSAAYRERIAEAIADGVQVYRKTAGRLSEPAP